MYPGKGVYCPMTKDGATVVKHIGLHHDQQIRNGVMLAVQSAVKQEKLYGDGTTLATILCLAYWLIVRDSGLPVRDAIRMIDRDLELFEQAIKDNTKQIETIEELKRIAMVSTNGDEELAESVTNSVWDAGIYGQVIAGFQQAPGVTTKKTEGYVFNCGIQDREFTNQGPTCVLDGVHYLLTEKMINSAKEIDHIIQGLIKSADGKHANLVIIGPEVGYSFRSQIISTFTNADLMVKVAFVSTNQLLPGKAKFVLEDIAAVTGAQIISDGTKSWKSYTESILGQSKSFYSDQERTIIFGTEADTSEHIAKLETVMKTAEDAYLMDLAKESHGMIKGGLHEIKIGALSEAELMERRDRADDAILACKSALRGGYIVGGGTLPHILSSSSEIDFSNVFRQVMQYPMTILITNGGVNPNDDLSYLKASKDHMKSVSEFGIFDPSDVVIGAFKNAWSVISRALLCKYMIMVCE
jgi:chaperonin GroEL